MPLAPVPADYHERVPLETGGHIHITRIEEEYPPTLARTVLSWIRRQLRKIVP